MDFNKHGADIYSASKVSGIGEDEIIDFSSNINPLGIPAGVKEAAIKSVKYSNRYPDINSRELIYRLSKHENISEDCIFCSNGAAESIFRIVLYLKPKKALLLSPTFSEYELALNTVGAEIEYFGLKEENNFNLTDDILYNIKEGTDIVFICNPNNPTGQLTDRNLLEKIIVKCSLINSVVVTDECFMDFTENNKNYTVTDFLGKYDNLIVLKAFTKIYAIPGIRLGYCMSSNKDIISGLKASGPPWNVSTIAQAAGSAALEETEYVIKTVKYIKEQREYLNNELKNLNIKIYESKANYVFFKYSGELDLKTELLKKGILIRSCSNYRNLDDKYFRIAVKTEHENKMFIKKLREIGIR